MSRNGDAAGVRLGLDMWGPVEALRLVGRGDVLPLGGGVQITLAPPAIGAAAPSSGTRIAAIDGTNGARVASTTHVHRVVRIGEIFHVDDLPCAVTNTRLERVRTRLSWSMGLTDHTGVDHALEIVAEGRPFAFVGDSSLDRIGLARTIHEESPQRDRPFVDLSARTCGDDLALGGTAFVDLDRMTMTSRLVRSLMDRRGRTRVIFAARSDHRLRYRLDAASFDVRLVRLTPLAQRRHEVVDLLAQIWRHELRARWSIGALGHGVAGLAGYRWPRNLDELRGSAMRLLAYLRTGAIRRAARDLGIKPQSLHGHFRRIGFTPDADTIDRDDGDGC